MESLCKNWKKLIIIVICCAILDMFLHALLPPHSYDYTPSYFVENGLFIPAAAIGLAIIFSLLATVFDVEKRHLKNNQFCSRSRKARILTTGVH